MLLCRFVFGGGGGGGLFGLIFGFGVSSGGGFFGSIILLILVFGVLGMIYFIMLSLFLL